MSEKRWNIDKEKLASKDVAKMHARYDAARTQMMRRTQHHELYGLLAKNKSIHEWSVRRGKTRYFSEGSTQYILRKVLANTIQRVPDGELTTQYDHASKEHVLLQYIFDNKVMASEIDGIDMMSNLTKAFKMSFIYAFAPVRTGFERDYDDDARIKFSLEQWSDVFINPDCMDICRPTVVYHRHYMSKDDVLALLDDDGNIVDVTYNEDVVRCIIDEDMFTAKDFQSEPMADKLKGSTSMQSIMLVTEYRRGAKEFVTFFPELNAEFRRVPNYDPRKGIPWNFLVLEPDADFPIGVSQVEFLLADQQFNDLFQTSAYKNLLLAMEPPIMVAGWETNPSSYRFEPRKIWNLGNNPNQVKVEPVKIDNAVLSNWTTTREAVAAAMVRNLNVADGTVAKDAGVGYSKTAPGVEQQNMEKTVNINQYQKRVESFMQEWAVQALRMYINSMHGEHRLTVDEETRRRLFDVGAGDCVDGDKVVIDFDELSADMLEFKVRAGSLIQKKEEQELDRLTAMVQPFIQNLNGWSDENRRVIENDVLLPAAMRMLELSDTDISNTLAESLSTQIAKNMMADMQAQIDMQQAQLDGMQGQIDATQQALPPESQEQLAQEPTAGSPVPMPQEIPDIAAAPSSPEGGMEALAGSPMPPEEEPMSDQVTSFEDLLSI
ncbi:MAG: hypothetical protein K5859_03500 [Atopobiaceae bacterium]|nr:hypothetical protein [Atopobiaceae bacterium]